MEISNVFQYIKIKFNLQPKTEMECLDIFYEKFYTEEQSQLEQNRRREDKERLCVVSFKQRFPNLNFEDLQKQIEHIRTKDECTHYYHKYSKLLYSWNYMKNKWYESTMNDDCICLFDNYSNEIIIKDSPSKSENKVNSQEDNPRSEIQMKCLDIFYEKFYTEEQHQLEQNRRREAKERSLIVAFKKKFPDLNFEDLQKQVDHISTDDGCTHYYHKHSKLLYSWDYMTNKWYESAMDEDSVSLFDKFSDELVTRKIPLNPTDNTPNSKNKVDSQKDDPHSEDEQCYGTDNASLQKLNYKLLLENQQLKQRIYELESHK